MTIDRVAELGRVILAEIEKAIVGKAEALEQVLIGLLADGHLLIEDYPGLAKTMIVQMFSQVAALTFKRVQCTPDLLPSDLTGSFLYNQREAAFQFRPGPIFTHLLLADEINRATPKTQAALLEAMQERQVTVEGQTFPLEAPFLVIATQNPIEFEGTYPLPEAQLDRFLMRLAVGYPSPAEEREILARRQRRKTDAVTLRQVVDGPRLREMQRAVEDVYASPEIERYIVEIVAATRADRRLSVGASPRGSLALLKVTRARAALRERDFVTPDDVKALAVPVLAHRVILRPELWATKADERDVIAEVLSSVATPKAE